MLFSRLVLISTLFFVNSYLFYLLLLLKITLFNTAHPAMGKISREDRIVIKSLRVEKNWSSRRFLKEFENKNWSRASLDQLIKKVDADYQLTELLVEVVAGQ